MKLSYFTAAFGKWILVNKGEEPPRTGGRPGDTLLRPGLPLERCLPALSKAGYDGIALCTWVGHSAYPWSLDPVTEERIKELLKENNLKVFAFGSHGGSRHVFDRFGYLTTDKEELNERILYIKECIKLASRFEVPVIDDVTGDIPIGMTEDEAFNHLAEIYKDLCNLAEECNVRIGIEPYSGPINSPEAFWRLKEMVSSEALGVTIDYSNLIGNKTVTSAPEAAKKLGSAAVHVHLKGRSFEGSITTPGGEKDTCDLRGFLREMEVVGYDGAVTLEEYPEKYKPALDPYQAAEVGYKSVAKIMEELGVRS